MFVRLLLLVAIVGLTACTGFLILILISAARFRRTRKGQEKLVDLYPPVTLLKPLCGLETRLETNLESFFQQDYPTFQIVFGTRTENDPALAVVRQLSKRYPNVSVTIVLSGEPAWPNAKVWSLEKMMAAASSDYLVISDSDVHVAPNYLREVVCPLLDPQVGLVTCLYRGVPTGGLWSRLEALGMSVEMGSGVLVAEMLEGMKFALGPTMAIRRDTLEAVGGASMLANYCADDYVLGNRVAESGRRVVLSSHVIDHVVLNRSFNDSMAHQIRWMKSTRFSRHKGHIGTGLTFAMPFGLLGLLAGLAAGNLPLAPCLLGFAVVNRIIMSVITGWAVMRDRLALRDCWLYPLRDLMGFGFWIASFLSANIVWRRERYRLEADGLMVRLSPTADESASGTVTVDNL